MAETTQTSQNQSPAAPLDEKLAQHPAADPEAPLESNKRVSDTIVEPSEAPKSGRQLTDAEKYLLTFKDRFSWSDLITADGTHLSPRSCQLLCNEKLGFYICTRTVYHKIQCIEQDPYATISFLPGDGEKAKAIAHCTIEVSNTPEDLDASWDDSLLKYGFTGKDDDRRRVLKITVHDVVAQDKTYEGVPLDKSKFTVAPRVPPCTPRRPLQGQRGRSLP